MLSFVNEIMPVQRKLQFKILNNSPRAPLSCSSSFHLLPISERSAFIFAFGKPSFLDEIKALKLFQVFGVSVLYGAILSTFDVNINSVPDEFPWGIFNFGFNLLGYEARSISK